MTRYLSLSRILVMLGVFLATGTRAQESSASTRVTVPGVRIGEVAGHAFIPTTFLQDPFVRTALRTGVGFGGTLGFEIPPPTVAGKPVDGLTGSLLFALLDLEYQHAIRDWLAVRLQMNVIGRLADETPTLISQGVTLASGFQLGWLFTLAESEHLHLSGTLQVKKASTTDIYLQRFLEGIIENGEVLPGNTLVATTPTLRGSTGVQGAYVISRLTGVTVTADLDYGESVARGDADRWFYRVAAAFDFNLLSAGGPPMGFVIGGATGSSPLATTGDTRTTQSLFGRIAYTGAEDFALGLDMSYALLPVRNLSDKQGFLSAVVDVRLYF